MNKQFVAFIVLHFLMVPVLPQTPISLTECRKEAMEYNQSLDAARIDVLYAEAAVKAARTAYLPKIDGSGSMMYMPDMDGFSMAGFFLPTAESAEAAAIGNFSGTSDVYFPGFQMELNELKLYMAEVGAEQPIFAGGQVRLANKKAKKGVELAQQALNLKQSEVVFGVDRAFWSLVAVQEQTVAIADYITALDSLVSDLASYYDLGLIPKSELLKVRVQRDEVRLQQVGVNNLLKITSMNLALLTGRPLDILLQAAPGGFLENKTEVFNLGLDYSSRPELMILEHKKEIALLDQKSIQGEYLPQIGLSVGYQYVKVPDLYSGGWNLSAGAGISIPLIHWREKKHKTDMARFNVMKMEKELNDTRDKASLEVQQNRFNLESGFEKVDLAKGNLDQAGETLSEVKLSYETGLNSITDLLNAQAGYQRALANLTETKANLEILKSAYLKSLGILASNSR